MLQENIARLRGNTPEISDSNETHEPSREKISQLRREYLSLVKQNAFTSPDDNKENLEWAEKNLFNADAATLQTFLEGYPRHVAFDKELVERWHVKVDQLIGDGLFSAKSKAEYTKWFLKQKAGDKIKYLEKSHLDDERRAKTLGEFNVLLEYFAASADANGKENVRKKFLDSDLGARQDMVADLKKKKVLIHGQPLPRVVRQRLRGAFVRSDDIGSCQKLVANALKTHAELKKRFLKLPPLITEEHTKEFQALDFPERVTLIDEIEIKMARYTKEYRAKITHMQKPEVRGLTLFSSETEEKRSSSAHKYMEWFTKKLTLKGMESACSASDLDSIERIAVRDEMAQLLEKFPERKHATIIEKFNSADLDVRKNLVVQHAAQAKREGEASRDEGVIGWIQGKLRGLLFSGARNELTRTTETWAVSAEIARRRHRARLAHHTTSEKLTEKASVKEQTETLARTQRIQGAVHSERLKNEKGDVKLKFEVLHSEDDARGNLKRVLKPEIENHNAKLTGIEIRTEGGEKVIDETAYQHGELARQREGLEDTVTARIMEQAKSAGLAISEKHITDELANEDWDKIGRETIQRAA